MAINKQQVYTRNIFSKDQSSEDNNGITVINPTKSKDGSSRYINQEDLIMYANLTAEQTPRNRVIDNADPRVINIANNRNVNFLNPDATNNGSLKKEGNLTTQWTKMFYEDEPYDSESFGIEEITITNNASMIPEVDITFIDVRGKNLWERANDPSNPYNVFLTFPYPLFYLTVKGYLGEGMGMPLVLKKVNTSFSGDDGHFRTVAQFQSWTFAMLNDILMQYAVLAPFMYELPDNEEYGYEGMKQLAEIFDRQKNRDEYNEEPEQSINPNNAPLTIVDLLDSIGNVVNEINNKQIAPEVVRNKNELKQLQSSFKQMNERIIDGFNELDNINTSSEGNYRVLPDDNPDYLVNQVQYFEEHFKSISENYYNNILGRLGESDSQSFLNENIFQADIPQNTGGNIVTIDSFVDTMNTVLNDIFVDLNNELNDEFVNVATNQVTDKLKFEPNLENILRIVCNNLQAFMELLANKSEKAYNQVLDDTVRQAQQRNVGDVNTSNGIPYPWPEYWTDEGDDGLQKDYPGKFYKDWEEVKFIDELVKARQRVDAILNVSQDKKSNNEKKSFNALPVDHPIDQRPYQDFEQKQLIKEIFQRASYSVFHEGYLYYGTEESISNIAESKGRLEAQNLIKIARDKGDSINRLSILDKVVQDLQSENGATPLQRLREYIIGGNGLETIQEEINNGNDISDLLDRSNLHQQLKNESLIDNPLLFLVTYSLNNQNYHSISEHNYAITENASEHLDTIQQNIDFTNSDNLILGLLNLDNYATRSVLEGGGNDQILGDVSRYYRNWNRSFKDNYRPITTSNSDSNIKNRLFTKTFDQYKPDESIYNRESNIEQGKYGNSE